MTIMYFVKEKINVMFSETRNKKKENCKTTT